MDEMTVLSPCGMLGYGFPLQSFEEGICRKPHIIGADAGSTDAGPHKLGAGMPDISRQATKRDITLMLLAGYEHKIPVIIGSAGGSGARTEVEWTIDIVREIVKEKDIHFKMAVIWADIDKDYVKRKVREGKVKPLGPEPDLDEATIDKTTRIVGQMGAEPFIRALDAGFDLIIAGRSCDSAIFAAPGLRAGFDPALAWHMGEILECGAMCAVPGAAGDCAIGRLHKDFFIIESPNPSRKCTDLSVAAHTLYERSHPYLLYGPDHIIDVSESKFEELPGCKVKVSGSKFHATTKYTIKLEGSALVGYRTLVIAGIRDPIEIQQIDEIMEAVRKSIMDFFSDVPKDDYQLLFHVYGKDGVMGKMEPIKRIKSHELCVILDVVAKTQDLANTICSSARAAMGHYHYKGCKATAANLAFPTSPSDIPFGGVYEFTVHHLVEVYDPCELFPMEIIQL